MNSKPPDPEKLEEQRRLGGLLPGELAKLEGQLRDFVNSREKKLENFRSHQVNEEPRYQPLILGYDRAATLAHDYFEWGPAPSYDPARGEELQPGWQHPPTYDFGYLAPDLPGDLAWDGSRLSRGQLFSILEDGPLDDVLCLTEEIQEEVYRAGWMDPFSHDYAYDYVVQLADLANPVEGGLLFIPIEQFMVDPFYRNPADHPHLLDNPSFRFPLPGAPPRAQLARNYCP